MSESQLQETSDSDPVTIVLGMHRSGTSLITRGLQTLGLDLGDDLATEPAVDNARGHWEDRGVVAVNDRLLAASGMSWDECGAVDPGLFTTRTMKALREEARALLDQRLSVSRGWAFKDPRTARLLPFWLQVLEESGHDVRFVWVIRDPAAVSQSLAARNGFSPLKSNLLWLAHNSSLLDWIGSKNNVVVDYARFLEAAPLELDRIAEAFTIEAPDQLTVSDFCENFIDPSLNHAHDDFEQGREPHGAALLARRGYQLLLQRAQNQPADTVWLDQWNDITREYAAYSVVCEHLDAAVRLDLKGADLLVEGFEQVYTQKQVLWKAETDQLRQQLDFTTEQSQAAERDSNLKIQKQAEAFEDRLALADEQLRLAMERAHLFETRLKEVGETNEIRSRELASTIDRLESKLEGLAKTLDQVTRDKLRIEDERDVYRKNQEDREVQLSTRQQQLNIALSELNRERYTVLKPVLRRGYRAGAMVAARLPDPLWNLLQKTKRKLYPGTVRLSVMSVPGEAAAESGSDYLLLDEVRAAANRLHDIIVFPVIDWHFRFQRPQQLSRQMAERGHRVFYLTTTFGDTSQPNFRILESPSDRIFIIQLCLPAPHPRIYEDGHQTEQWRQLTVALRTFTTVCGLSNIISIVDLPFWRAVAETIPGNLLVYDCMDHHGGFSTNSNSMLEEENRLLVSADLVITSSERLSKMIGKVADNVLIRNAGDIDYFSTVPDTLPHISDRPVVGYLGAIAEWFDIDLIADAARNFPDWQFVLVGSTESCDVSSVRGLSNVKLIGEVPYEQAAGWVHSFDVALIPFKITELTLCTNPVKVYEYLAAGKPVVSTALPEVALMGDMVHVAQNAADFHRLLKLAMDEADDRELSARRTRWAGQHDWSSRGSELEKALKQGYPKVSVIVLTYNNLDFTRACLFSLEQHSQYPDWELIIVDNASSDETPEFLEDFSASRPWVKLILNQQNMGFAAGNNVGLQAAEGDYLILLNNDTYVTDGWILDLIRPLRENSLLGLVGPVTNNIGNEARIEIHYADMEEMADAANAYTTLHAREIFDTQVVAFFCAAMRREVYEQIGGLDESFGRGFFEDDDYCNRVREAGFSIGIAENVFIHHHLSGSFAKLEDSERAELFKRNKAIYEEKWGEWIPHSYRAR